MAALIAPGRREHCSRQLNAAPGITGKNRLCGLGRFYTSAHEFRSDLESSLGCVGVMEGTGVSNKCGVDAFGDLFGYPYACSLTEIVDHFTDCGRSRVDPVNCSKQRGS